ncbi:hypothetical protein Hamer_G008530 [Homarus americanus]|uniref:DUF4832 domain-containing protein n=1 Tax=Homarus americanus TaxID=6706 RepID=A0A8J5TJ81_HOMAM|nr:hypothetical protein Hamer_G008530 [Homarus americanus]
MFHKICFLCCVLSLICNLLVLSEPTTAPGAGLGRGNPERGFYKYSATLASAWTPFKPQQLQEWIDDGYTLVFRYVVLDTFVYSDISSDILQKISKDFDTLRDVGMKTVLRFCYTFDENNHEDAKPAQLASHLQQLTPILQEHVGVIAVMQAGFIGVWGEWYFTANYGDEDHLTDKDWYNRGQVVNELLQALPASRQIQLRTPYYKRNILDRSSPITEDEAFQDTPVARIGQHNDCFLASDNDIGTYKNKSEEYPYVEQETLYLSIGGETCKYNPTRSYCPTALKEMSELHYRFLNGDNLFAVLSSWKIQGCYDTIWSSMGYRLVGKSAQVPDQVLVGGEVNVGVQVTNQGWAAPINYRSGQLVLHHVSSGVGYISEPANVDLRNWQPGDHSVQLSMTLPDDAPIGQYKVLLSLPDGDTRLQDNAAFNIVMENMVDSQDPGSRLNLLGFLTAV